MWNLNRIVAGGLVLAVATVAWAQESQPGTASQPAELSLPPSSPLVLAAWGAPKYSDDVVARYQEFAQAGFTHAVMAFKGDGRKSKAAGDGQEPRAPLSDVQRAKAMLDAAQAAGVKLLPQVWNSKMSGPEIAVAFKDHPALAGYYLADEPETARFADLARQAREILAVDPDPAKVITVNLLPNFATNPQMGIEPGEPYSQYVHKFMSEVPVNVLSDDHYPIDRLSVSRTWYANQEVMMNAAKMRNIPWWAVICAIGFNQAPDPSLGSMRIQYYTNLAYGATGIDHWYYWYYRNGRAQAIDAEGRRTATWEIDRQVNREVQAQASVFVGSDVRRVRWAGPNPPPEVKPLEPRGGILTLEAGNKGAIVSELWKESYRFLVIVNQDYLEPMPLSVTWRDSMQVGLVQKDGSVKMLPEPSLKMGVEPGDAAILMWMARGE